MARVGFAEDRRTSLKSRDEGISNIEGKREADHDSRKERGKPNVVRASLKQAELAVVGNIEAYTHTMIPAARDSPSSTGPRSIWAPKALGASPVISGNADA